MKKKVLFIVMGLSIMALAAGCTKKDPSSNLNDTTATEAPVATGGAVTEPTVAPADIPKVEEYVASDYITLGNYKGLAVNVTQLEVTDADVEAKIQSDLAANPTKVPVTDRAVQTGDTVNMDYEGLLDGVAFDGGTAQAQDLVIGSGNFIPGFEDKLIGAKIGDKLSLDITFPADYSQADLAGKPVVFKVTINSISLSTPSELTVDYVKANTDYDTIEAYKAGVRKDLETANQDTMDNQKASNVITAIIDDSTIKSVPQTLTDYYTASLNYQYNQQATSYGMDFASFLQLYGMTQDDFNTYLTTAVKAYATRDLIINAVAQTEKMEVSKDEYDKAVTDYLSYYNVTTEADLLKQVSKEEINNRVVMQKAYDLIVDKAVTTMVSPTPVPTATTAPTATTVPAE